MNGRRVLVGGVDLNVMQIDIHIRQKARRDIREKTGGVAEIQLRIGESGDTKQHQSKDAADDFWPCRSLFD